MPIIEYCGKDRTDCEEVIYLAGEKVLPKFNNKRRVISSPTIKFRGPFSGGSTTKNVIHEAPPGQRVLEAGVEKDIKRAETARTDKQDKERTEFIEKELRTLDL